MAEDNPTFTVKAPGFNTWGNVGISKDNDFYKLLDETKEKTDAVFEVVNLVFDLVNSALDFIASLLIDFTNPLKPIIEAIIAFLDSFISDLRNFGWYLTYDKKQFKNPAEKLLGGYPAFESRIIEKLLKIKDPTRPNFSPESKVFAMTFFAGADASSLGAIISAIKKLLKLFLTLKGPSDKAEAPINLQVGYYNDVVGSIEIPNVYKPDGVRVKWNLPPPPSTNKILPKSFILPDYFLFSVATRQATERIAYINRKPRDPYDEVGIDAFGPEKSTVQELIGDLDARLWPLIKTDSEFTKLDESKVLERLDQMPDGIGTLGSFILKGDDDYYLNKIGEEKISDVYRCFVYGSGGGALFGDNDFSFDIPLESLKINDSLASEYFITIYSLTMESNDYDSISKKKKDLPSGGLNIRVGTHELVETGEFLINKPWGNKYYLGIEAGELSKPSATVVVKSPSEIREKYLKAVKFYFLAHLLAQPYIESHKAKLGYENPVGKEETLLKEFAESIEGKNLHQNKQTSQAFALGIQEWLRKIMIRFKEGMPSDATLRSLSNSLDKINSFPLDLEVLVKNEVEGEHHDLDLYPDLRSVLDSIKNIEIEQELITSNYDGVAQFMYAGTKPKYKASDFMHDKWPESKQPVIFDDAMTGFVGHLIFHKEFRETFRLAQRVVTLSPPSVGGGEWLNQRPFRDSDISALTNFIDTVKKYMEGFLKGLEGIVAQILKFIHMLKTRIAQVQAIIARIKALIDLILSFRFPAGLYGTFHLADGTAGLVSALQQSEDKPDIGTSGYGTGVMVVAGGVPTILIDFLIALMGGEGEE